MSDTYKIGAFTFDTEEEYNKALKEYNRIKEIYDKCDLNDPDTVRRLLILVKNKKLPFETEVGKSFVKVLVKKYKEQNPDTPLELPTNKTNTVTTARSTTEELPSVPHQQTPLKPLSKAESKAAIKAHRKGKPYGDEVILPVIVEASTARNLFSILKFILSFVLMYVIIAYQPFRAQLDFILKPLDKNLAYDEGDSVLIYYILATIIIIWYFIIHIFRQGSRNLKNINKKEKDALEYIKSHTDDEETKRQIEEEESLAATTSFFRAIGGIIMFILFLTVPPLALAIMVVLLIIGQIDNIKWLWKNKGAGIIGIFILIGYVMTYMLGAYTLIARNTGSRVHQFFDMSHAMNIPETSCLAISLVLPVVYLLIIRVCLHRQTYLGMRNILSYPIMFLMVLLPFVGVGLMAYAMLAPRGNGGGNPNGGTGGGGNPNGGIGPQFIYAGAPPVYQVHGYWRHAANGTLVYVKPYYRTMPDATTLNNLFPH